MIGTYSRVEACGCDDSLTGAFFFNVKYVAMWILKLNEKKIRSKTAMG